MSPPRPQVLAFLEAIKESPDDDTPRLILADWLRENGDEARGEFIALQCDLAGKEENHPKRADLQERTDELLRRYWTDWVGPLGPLLNEGQFRRGLFTAEINDWALLRVAKEAPLWREKWAWIESLRLRGSRSLRRALRLTVFRQITGLELIGHPIGDDGLDLLLSSPNLTRLCALRLGGHDLSTTGVTLLSCSPLWAGLLELSLPRNVIDDVGVAVLASSCPPRLARLDLSSNVFRLFTPRIASVFKGLRHLCSLNLSDNQLQPRAVEALAALDWTRLTELNMDRTGLGDGGVKELVRGQRLASLTMLSLCDNEIETPGVLALVDSPYLGRLRCLRLGRNRISTGAAAALTARFGKAVRFD
jgi:uncharacterized protein (TIGR02996 family)